MTTKTTLSRTLRLAAATAAAMVLMTQAAQAKPIGPVTPAAQGGDAELERLSGLVPPGHGCRLPGARSHRPHRHLASGARPPVGHDGQTVSARTTASGFDWFAANAGRRLDARRRPDRRSGTGGARTPPRPPLGLTALAHDRAGSPHEPARSAACLARGQVHTITTSKTLQVTAEPRSGSQAVGSTARRADLPLHSLGDTTCGLTKGSRSGRPQSEDLARPRTPANHRRAGRARARTGRRAFQHRPCRRCVRALPGRGGRRPDR